MIATLKPYRQGGKALLYAIHALNSPDKHRPGLVPINMQTVVGADEIAVYKGMILTFGPRSGRHLVVDMDGNLSQPDKTKAPGLQIVAGKPQFFFGPLIGKKPKTLIPRIYNQTERKIAETIPNLAEYIAKAKLSPPKDDMEIATAIPGTKFQTETRPSFNIALGDIESFEREPAIVTLDQMRQLVDRILLTFERRFFV